MLKVRSHSQDIAGQVIVSRAKRCKVGKLSRASGRLHQVIASSLSVRGVAELAVECLPDSSLAEMSPFFTA
jgi:hypothetical protein